jgi:hypothetical protein
MSTPLAGLQCLVCGMVSAKPTEEIVVQLGGTIFSISKLSTDVIPDVVVCDNATAKRLQVRVRPSACPFCSAACAKPLRHFFDKVASFTSLQDHFGVTGTIQMLYAHLRPSSASYACAAWPLAHPRGDVGVKPCCTRVWRRLEQRACPSGRQQKSRQRAFARSLLHSHHAAPCLTGPACCCHVHAGHAVTFAVTSVQTSLDKAAATATHTKLKAN